MPLITDHFSTTESLIDVGSKDPRWAGIWAPASYGEEVVQKYIHQQFLDESETYLRKYQDQSLWRFHLQNAFIRIGVASDKQHRILDLGSGGGNTIFPLLGLSPNSVVIASDLSLPLLYSLRKGLNTLSTGSNCFVLQLNAEELIFTDDQFDLVVGAAILHHLFAPESCIREVSRVLKPGGSAIFFEPFETGHLIVSRALKDLAARSDAMGEPGRNHCLSADIYTVFKKLWIDWDMRKGRDKTAAIFKVVDDKWLFTRSYFEEIAMQSGFKSVDTYNLYSTDGLFSRHLNSLLRLTLGKSLEDLPIWARAYLMDLDENYSVDARKDLIIEGGLILRK